jgi:thymidylate kinase
MNERGRTLTNAEREFFARFFARLEEARVVSIFLRNYEKFPEAIGHDLDVFFRRADLDRAIEIFRSALRDSGGEILHVHERDYVFAVWFHAAKNEPAAIHLDFYHGAFTWHGLPYLDEHEVISAARNFGNFKTPRPAHEALNLFLTSLLWGGFFKTRYRERIAALLQSPEESAEFFRVLERKFGSNSKPPFDFKNEVEIPRGEMRRYAERLRSLFKKHSLLRQPFATIFKLSRYWSKELGTLFSPPGICIAILGPDGSGKSTVIEAAKERIEYFFGEVEHRHWRPHLLRDVGVMLGRRDKTAAPVSDPHGRAPHSAAISAMRFFYYWLDYWLGWPARVWKFRAKNHLVIFDRYAEDMWCDPARYRLRLPKTPTRFLCRIVPQPDLTFVLLADAEIIHARKGEVPLSALREVLKNYAQVAKQNSRTVAVDCSRPVNQVADEIAGAVRSRLKQKIPRTRLRSES